MKAASFGAFLLGRDFADCAETLVALSCPELKEGGECNLACKNNPHIQDHIHPLLDTYTCFLFLCWLSSSLAMISLKLLPPEGTLHIRKWIIHEYVRRSYVVRSEHALGEQRRLTLSHHDREYHDIYIYNGFQTTVTYPVLMHAQGPLATPSVWDKEELCLVYTALAV